MMRLFTAVKRSYDVNLCRVLCMERHNILYTRLLHNAKSCIVEKSKNYLTSKEIRKLFMDYFVSDKKHTYMHSSPVFLNNDPSLLFVNAGMNQFKSVLLNKVLPSHEFYHLKKVVNSQKCIRISGKHNDLDQVGHDFHHHTFFEMLGNWSFGDYFKREACEMAWELLTKVYGLPVDRLYVTYFGGDESLGLPCDEECKNIWLNIGVAADHIFPFGVKDNFWDMGDHGPCGPCTEIHYDYLGHRGSDLSPSQRLNAGYSDLIEIWNLVFIQFNRGKSGTLESLPKHNVDTGMGLERLTAVIQGRMSNYDTDIFSPLFTAIEKNFNVRPYMGYIGEKDTDGIDTAYRIIADHSRMFTVAITDGLFPDSYDAGHILRKIIRKAAYTANCVMKTRPGYLSTLVPYVVESLIFFPELEKHVDEVVSIINDEEKMLHQLINRGRKVRNRMAVNAVDKLLDGKNVWELHNVYGLDENIIDDLATEINLNVDWNGYQKIVQEQEQKSSVKSNTEDGVIVSPEVIKTIQNMKIKPTKDFYKYNYNYSGKTYTVEDIQSKVVAVIQNGSYVNEVLEGQDCLVVTDSTNFYSCAGGQVADVGQIFNEGFIFNVENVHEIDGYIFHQGKVIQGRLLSKDVVNMLVNKEHRHRCTCNHTATHLLNAALRTVLPYTSQRSSYVDPSYLRLGFSAKVSLNAEQIDMVETIVNNAIEKRLDVSRVELPFEEVLTMPNVAVLHGENYPDVVTAVMIGDKETPENLFTVEPCCGTHVKNTAHIEHFVILSSKSLGGTVKILHAVTSEAAEDAILKGEAFQKKLKYLEEKLLQLESENAERTAFIAVLKEVKSMLRDCADATNIPLKVLRHCEESLKEMKHKLLNITKLSSKQESPLVEQKKSPGSSLNSHVTAEIEEHLCEKNIPSTIDLYKYKYYCDNEKYHIEPVSAKVFAIFQNNSAVRRCEYGQQCIIVTDKTNFYAEGDGQAGDRGVMYCEDFAFNVTDVYQKGGHIFHEGWIEKGSLELGCSVHMAPDEQHRKNCSLNHTASHLLHSSLKKLLPFAIPVHVFAGPSFLQMNFHTKGSLSLNLLQKIEDLISKAIQDELSVSRIEVPTSKLKEIPDIVLYPGEDFPTDVVPIISISSKSSDSEITSVEPCYGTHATNTSHIGLFVITSSKSNKNLEKVLRAVTSKQAEEILAKSECYEKEMSELEDRISETLKSHELDYLELWDLLKEVKVAKNRHETELPLIPFRKHQDKLSELTVHLNEITKSFVEQGFSQAKTEISDVLRLHEDSKYIIHKIKAVGDGKKLVNYALKAVQDKPSIFFAADGHKTIVCSCAVPENCVSLAFSALLWIQPVATFLEGRARFHSKNPELYYSIESHCTDKVDEAVKIAKKYVESNL